MMDSGRGAKMKSPQALTMPLMSWAWFRLLVHHRYRLIVGALIIRVGFEGILYCTLTIIRNHQKPVLIIEAPYITCQEALCSAKVLRLVARLAKTSRLAPSSKYRIA